MLHQPVNQLISSCCVMDTTARLTLAFVRAQTYDQIYPQVIVLDNVTNGLNYTSPVLHTVELTDLEPNTTYYYQVGDGNTMSDTFTFRTLAAAGEDLSLDFLFFVPRAFFDLMALHHLDSVAGRAMSMRLNAGDPSSLPAMEFGTGPSLHA